MTIQKGASTPIASISFLRSHFQFAQREANCFLSMLNIRVQHQYIIENLKMKKLQILKLYSHRKSVHPKTVDECFETSMELQYNSRN